MYVDTCDENEEDCYIPSEENYPNQNSDEHTGVESEDTGNETIENQDEATLFTPSSGCDYILPDVARNVRCTCHHNCNAAEIALLKTNLEQKSIALDTCLSTIDSLRKELGTAKEHIFNLRAQLEENTHALCSYLTMTTPKDSV